MKIMMKIAMIAVIFTAFSVLHAQSPTESDIYNKLVQPGKESVLALDAVLKNTDSSSAAVLFIASTVAFRQKRVEDAAFLIYIGEIRAQFDHALFPPAKTGDADPVETYSALEQQLGNQINPAIMEKPKLFAKVLEKVKSWRPNVAAGYAPGWEYSKKASEKEAEAVLINAKREFSNTMDGVCALLQDRTYFAAFKTARNYNLKTGFGRPSQKECDSAVQTMQRIEREKNIYGFATHAQ